MTRRKRNEDKSCQKLSKSSQKTLRVDFEREIEWLRAKRDEVWQRVALLERVAGGDHVEDDDDDVDHAPWEGDHVEDGDEDVDGDGDHVDRDDAEDDGDGSKLRCVRVAWWMIIIAGQLQHP